MSKCIDCLHYEACKGAYDILDTTCSGEFDYEEFARSCKNFADHSDWARLPCEAGDKVWYITGIGHNLIRTECISFEELYDVYHPEL